MRAWIFDANVASFFSTRLRFERGFQVKRRPHLGLSQQPGRPHLGPTPGIIRAQLSPPGDCKVKPGV